MMNLRTVWAAFVVGVFLTVFAACAKMPAVDTFNKRTAAAYVTVKAVSDTATAGVRSGKLKPEDARSVVAAGRAALDGLQVATTLATLDPRAAEDRLVASLAILQALQSYLAQRGVQ